jgi:hypothetical protein
MQQADVWIGLLNGLAIHLEYETQHTVRGRVLRTEVERVILDVSHVRGLA